MPRAGMKGLGAGNQYAHWLNPSPAVVTRVFSELKSRHIMAKGLVRFEPCEIRTRPDFERPRNPVGVSERF